MNSEKKIPAKIKRPTSRKVRLGPADLAAAEEAIRSLRRGRSPVDRPAGV